MSFGPIVMSIGSSLIHSGGPSREFNRGVSFDPPTVLVGPPLLIQVLPWRSQDNTAVLEIVISCIFTLYLSTTWSFWRHLGAFGAQKGVFRVVIGRARHGATSPERHHQVALTSLLERPYQSDREKSLAVSSLGDARTSPERPPGATPRSRSHLTPLSERPPKATPRGRSRLYGETTRSEAWSDLSERPTKVAPDPERPVGATHQSRSRPLAQRHQKSALERLPGATPASRSASILDHPRSNPYAHEFSFPLVKKVEGLEGQEELCFINNNGSWYKKEPNFQYNNYQQKSYPNNQQSAQKGVFRVVIGRARYGATSPERHHQVALTSLLERPYQSDREKSLAVSSLGDARTSPERPPGATPRSRSHLTPLSERPPKATPRGRSRLYGETTRSEAWSDLSERPTKVAPNPERPVGVTHQSWSDTPKSLATSRPETPKIGPGATSRSDTCKSLRVRKSCASSTTMVAGTKRSPTFSTTTTNRNPIPTTNRVCFDIPQNWFDNFLYYNICLRSLENS
ncbi:hypothetical protein IGI04_023536 [Brassica rapa subsp. trilocularis]|uniref:DUF4005 domain-containing protein n=1 Tax=Brassica rapa subsp. trilocularis TaxID=1813537 RepID=A0ABQ7M449_BRACM|nr:hypothetical protein IGI04_023536 [Brassica rapa subsp. trilocularis]